MSEIWLGRGSKSRPVQLGTLLGEGAAGKVHALPEMPGHAAKLYHDAAEARRQEAKIDAMIASPPDLPPALHQGIRYPQIAWPEAKLHDRAGRFTGFVMPEIDFAHSTSLVNLLQKNSRRVEKLPEHYGYRVLVARNLASVFAELHRAGHHMIDMKPANLRFYPKFSWMGVVDTDGFSIADANGRIPADQLSDEYIAPESWRRAPAELGIEQDRFALAAIIFQLLNNGVHPFAGAPGATGSARHATDLQGRILAGLYPYALTPNPELAPSAASLHRMFRRSTRELFDRAFIPGRRRPDSGQWRDHLDILITQLTPCAARPDAHVHFGAGCGFCAHEARRNAAAVAASARRETRPAARPREPARPIPVHPAPMRSAPYPSAAHWRRRGGGTVFLSVLLVAGTGAGIGYATRDQWLPLLPFTSEARAAGMQSGPFAVPSAQMKPFAEPQDFLTKPADDAFSVPLRSGPGANFAAIEELSMYDPVVGRGALQPGMGGALHQRCGQGQDRIADCASGH